MAGRIVTGLEAGRYHLGNDDWNNPALLQASVEVRELYS